MATSVDSQQRFKTSASPCPICGGWERMKRGQGTRCCGYRSSDGKYAFCTRSEHAGEIEPQAGTEPEAYMHILQGPCKCGAQHGAVVTPLRTTTTKQQRSGEKELVSVYSYHDATGRLAYQVLRYSDKSFQQRRPDNGKWAYNLKDVTRLPYRLPDLLKAPDDAIIYLPEGEKDVDGLISRGFFATTNSGGAGNWQDSCTPYLKDRRVVILPDNDEKGEKHAKDVAQKLQGVAREVRIVKLPDLPAKGDVTDWFEAGRTAQEFETLTNPIPLEPGVFFSDVKEEEIHWLWKNRIPRGKITIMDGLPDQGKSVVSTDLIGRVTRGDVMPDGAPGIKGAVIIVAPEDGAGDTIKPRLLAARADVTKVLNLTTIRFRNDKGEIDERPFSMPRDLPLLEEQIVKYNVVLVVLDPLMAVLDHGLKAKDDQDVRQAFTPLARVLDRTGCAALIIRHFNKGSSDNAILRGAGSIGIIGAARSGMVVVPDPDDDNKHVLATPKHNLADEKPAHLVYQINSDSFGRPCVKWLGAGDYTMSDLLSTVKPGSSRQEILQILKEADEPLGPRDIVDASTLNYDQARQLLSRMLKAGEIVSVSRGKYTLSHSSQLSQASQTPSSDSSDDCDDTNKDCDSEEECHNYQPAIEAEAKEVVTLVTDVTMDFRDESDESSLSLPTPLVEPYETLKRRFNRRANIIWATGAEEDYLTNENFFKRLRDRLSSDDSEKRELAIEMMMQLLGRSYERTQDVG